MTRGNARELAVHLIYGRNFTGEEPETVVATRLNKEYYDQLSGENEVYADRPSRAQMIYIDGVVSGVANREEDLNAREDSGVLSFPSRRGLTPRGILECNPEIPAFPGYKLFGGNFMFFGIFSLLRR